MFCISRKTSLLLASEIVEFRKDTFQIMKKMYTQRRKIANPQDITTMNAYIFGRMNVETFIALI